MTGMARILVVALALTLAACGDDRQASQAPPPAELTRAALGHYCNMIVADHLGPKAQIWLKGATEPVWFSSVRDGFAFTMLPDEPKTTTAFYVNDMARASWDRPEPGTWIPAREAQFVIESARRGGMGALEAVPFGSRDAARAFVARFGGRIVAYDQMPRDYILSSDEPKMDMDAHSEEERHD